MLGIQIMKDRWKCFRDFLHFKINRSGLIASACSYCFAKYIAVTWVDYRFYPECDVWLDHQDKLEEFSNCSCTPNTGAFPLKTGFLPSQLQQGILWEFLHFILMIESDITIRVEAIAVIMIYFKLITLCTFTYSC